MTALIPIQPEFQYFTAVEIMIHIDGLDQQHDYSKSFYISKIGEHFTNLTITEGALTNSNGEQFAPDLNGSNTASGKVTLIDEDNSIFRALLTSKSSEGSQLTNFMDITIKTYTGTRTYDHCMITNWSLTFSEGYPVITLDWDRIPNSGVSKDKDNNVTPSFKPEKANAIFHDRGITTFKEFKDGMNEVFSSPHYTLVYAKDGNINQLNEIPDSGELPEGKIKITPSTERAVSSGESTTSEGVFRFEIKPEGQPLPSNNLSLLQRIMNEFCHNSSLEKNNDPKDNHKYNGFYWKQWNGDKIILYPTETVNNRIEPNENEQDILSNVVFVYNSSISQFQTYNTPMGEKFAIPIDSLSCTINKDSVIYTNLESQANKKNPNGNMIITSGGRIMLPQGLPQAITSAIMKMSSLNMTEAFTVDITVYNFVHFYSNGRTKVYIVAFDHLGQVHPMTGVMRVYKYTYTIGEGGVVKAQVTLKPDFTAEESSFYSNTGFFLRDFVVNGKGEPIGVMENQNEEVVDYTQANYQTDVPQNQAKDYTTMGDKLSLKTALDLYSEFLDKYWAQQEYKGKYYYHNIPSSFLYKLVKNNCIWLVNLIIGVAGYAIYFDDDTEASRVISKQLLDEAGVRDPVLDYGTKNPWTDITSEGKQPSNPVNKLTTGVGIAHYNKGGLIPFYKASPLKATLPLFDENGNVQYYVDDKGNEQVRKENYTIVYNNTNKETIYGWGMRSSSSTNLNKAYIFKNDSGLYLANTNNGLVTIKGNIDESNCLMIGPEYGKDGDFMTREGAEAFQAWCKYHLENRKDALFPAALWFTNYWAPYYSWSNGKQMNSIQDTMIYSGIANSQGVNTNLCKYPIEEVMKNFVDTKDGAESKHRQRRLLNLKRAVALVSFIKRVESKNYSNNNNNNNEDSES